MDWEAPIMEKCAEYICHNKGDILEIGFGMGICADYIQAQEVNSHTIIEIHPQILERLNAWASGKSNVTVIEGDWANLSLSGTYDGIFLDTFADDSLAPSASGQFPCSSRRRRTHEARTEAPSGEAESSTHGRCGQEAQAEGQASQPRWCAEAGRCAGWRQEQKRQSPPPFRRSPAGLTHQHVARGIPLAT